MRRIPNTNEIGAYLHCGLCLKERPKGVSPREHGQLEFGFTKLGLQVWCKRHECNVLHIDFQGHKHPANLTRPGAEGETQEGFDHDVACRCAVCGEGFDDKDSTRH